jgi:hypothetical protein
MKETMSALTSSLIVFACIFGGALVGMLIHRLLPDDQLGTDSKDVVRLGMGLVATTVALVLGLLVASAKNFYDTQNTEVTQFAANIILLDRILAHYGPEAAEARAALPNLVTHLIEVIEPGDSTKTDSQHGALRGEVILEKIQVLSPKDDNQRSLRQQASSVAIQIGQIRWLMYEQNTVPVPPLLFVMLVFWLTALFVSFGLYAPRNLIVLASLFVAALAVTGTIFLIIEMYHPSVGMIRVSDAPLRSALRLLGQ